MKRALRIILPIIMVFVIICSLHWYLMVYDRGFTKDAILFGARTFEKLGQPKMATWCYNLAYKQSTGNSSDDSGDSVAIELANYYKQHGNYTKAEYTLTHAIAKEPTINLYIALCQTYVEQDKLLDAVDLLDKRIKDDSIRAQIDAMRPPVPTITPEPTILNDRIHVELKAEVGDLYVNYKGECPSTETDAYKGSYQLPEGQTFIYALAVNDNDLVSKPLERSYTVRDVIEPVEFTDKALDAYVRKVLNFAEGTTIYTNDLWDITTLELPEDVTGYADLPAFINLETLIIPKANSADLVCVSQLTKLKVLSINGFNISQETLKAIGSLTSLEKLTLTNTGLSTIAPFSGLVNLTYLDLSSNSLGRIDVMANFTKLTELYISDNALTDLSALSPLEGLTLLDVSHNSLMSLEPIKTLTALTELRAGHNSIVTLKGIDTLTSLQTLSLVQNGLEDISPLATCSTIQDMDLSYNKIQDLSILSELKNLVRVDLSHNEVEELPEFTAEHKLASFSIAYNLLSDIEALSILPELYFVDIDYNSDVKSLEPLEKCHHLMEINCYGTGVAVNPFSDESGVIVNYDPSLVFEEDPN